MCLHVNIWSRKRVAKSDIHCFKILRQTGETSYASPFMYTNYFMGEVKTAELDKPEPNGLSLFWKAEVDKGLHSFANDIDTCKYLLYNFGFSNLYVVCRAVIPKGSAYYIGRFGGWKSYASDKLMVTGLRL